MFSTCHSFHVCERHRRLKHELLAEHREDHRCGDVHFDGIGRITRDGTAPRAAEVDRRPDPGTTREAKGRNVRPSWIPRRGYPCPFERYADERAWEAAELAWVSGRNTSILENGTRVDAVKPGWYCPEC